jgi:hypothetical protein
MVRAGGKANDVPLRNHDVTIFSSCSYGVPAIRARSFAGENRMQKNNPSTSKTPPHQTLAWSWYSTT